MAEMKSERISRETAEELDKIITEAGLETEWSRTHLINALLREAAESIRSKIYLGPTDTVSLFRKRLGLTDGKDLLEEITEKITSKMLGKKK